MQWRRSVIKYEGQDESGQAIKLLQVPRKISFTFHFWHKSSIPDDVKLAELSNNSSKWKNMTFLVESKHTLTPTNFQGSRPPAAQDLLPWVDHEYWLAHDQMTMLIVSSDLSIVPCSYNERTRVNTFISFTIYFWVCFACLSCVHQRVSFFMFYVACFLLIVFFSLLSISVQMIDWTHSHICLL